VALIIPFQGKTPSVASDAFLAPTAVLIGDVTVQSEASVWFGAVLRGDHAENGIVVGPRTSIQDNCVIHVAWRPTVIGADCTIGHGAVFEGCVIGDGTVVGMNAVILQEARIGEQCVVAAGAVVREGEEVPPRSLVAGVPATVRKTLEGSAAEWVEGGGRFYVALARRYLAEGIGSPHSDGTRPDEG
jgi:carbonic anhydrase/acetyltransferase-like protein (isoleucine patch superfamily)